MSNHRCAGSVGHLSLFIVGPAALALLVAASSPLHAQNCLGSAGSSDASTTGVARLQASTFQVGSGCPGNTNRTELWIEGAGPYGCGFGATWNSQLGSCVIQASHPTTADGQKAWNQLGPWTGRSNHWSINGVTGLWESIQQGRTTSLYAGSEEDLCAEQGADYYWNGFECVYAPGSPIIISTAKSKKYKLTSVEAGVLFDIDGDGFIDRVAWTEAKDDVAFLALDRDGDGQITSGRELFGNHTLPGIRHGFAALAQMAFESSGERRGSVSSDDPLFAKLLLWTDRNHDGQSDVSELQPAAEIVSQIGLGYGVELTNFDNHGNWFRLKGWAHVRSGPGKNESKSGKDNEDRTRDIWDVFLKVQRP